MNAMPEPTLQAAPLPALPLPAPAAVLPLNPACGWWESSLDLQAGLSVTEHGGFEPLGAAVLPLWQLQ